MNELTKDEAVVVAELIDFTLFDYIRTAEDVDSMYWLRNITRAYEKLCEYSGYCGLTEESRK